MSNAKAGKGSKIKIQSPSGRSFIEYSAEAAMDLDTFLAHAARLGTLVAQEGRPATADRPDEIPAEMWGLRPSETSRWCSACDNWWPATSDHPTSWPVLEPHDSEETR